jgi:hypothetical protein
MPPSTADALYDALVALRASSDPLDRRHDAEWRAIDGFLRATFPGGGSDGDETRQETLIAIARGVHAMEATVPLAAMKWVSTIHRRKKVDAIRARSRDPVERGLARGASDEGTSILDRLESEGARPDEEAIARVIATIEDQVAAMLAESEASPAIRHLRRLQARASLRRLVLEEGFEAIIEALDADEPLTRERVYKWVERGRAIVTAALDRWAREAGEGSTVAEVAGVVREVMVERRVDAGRPRPARRRRGPL